MRRDNLAGVPKAGQAYPVFLVLVITLLAGFSGGQTYPAGDGAHRIQIPVGDQVEFEFVIDDIGAVENDSEDVLDCCGDLWISWDLVSGPEMDFYLVQCGSTQVPLVGRIQ